MEMETKQVAIDSIHTQLRDSSKQLGEERRCLEQREARVNERNERKFKIANFRRAEEEERNSLARLQQEQGQMGNGDVSMMIGDADKGYMMLPPNIPGAAVVHDHRLAASLPSPTVLRNTTNAYTNNNQSLELGVKGLKSKSRDLEAKYRKLITLCVSVPDSKVDELLGPLITAVDSEQEEVELGRVRDFLQKVESC